MFNGCGTFLAVKCYKSLIERKPQNIWGACWWGFCVVQRWHGNNDHLKTVLYLCDKEQLNSDHFLNTEKKSGFFIVLLICSILDIFLFPLARSKILHSYHSSLEAFLASQFLVYQTWMLFTVFDYSIKWTGCAQRLDSAILDYSCWDWFWYWLYLSWVVSFFSIIILKSVGLFILVTAHHVIMFRAWPRRANWWLVC